MEPASQRSATTPTSAGSVSPRVQGRGSTGLADPPGPAAGAATLEPGAPDVGGPRRAARVHASTALLAGLFCLCITAALVIRHVQSKLDDPLLSPELQALKESLRENPKDESLKGRIRSLDLELRRAYFRQLTFQATGAWLLVGGAAVLVWSSRRAARCGEQAHRPRAVTDAGERQERSALCARRAVIAAGGVLGIGFLALGFADATALPQDPAQLEKFLARLAGGGAEEEPGPASAELFRANWPRFLGASGNAFSSVTAIPDRWDLATGAGVVWRAAFTNAGFNSPVVWSNRVFVSAGDVRQREVFSFDAATGALVWRRPVANLPGSPPQPPEIPEGTGYAAPSMAVDGRRAFALFGNGDLAAFRFDGTLAWAKHLGVPKNQYGHATSLVPWQNLLLVQIDQGEAEQNRSRLHAFDGLTGRTVWERTRSVPESWATPCVAEAPSGPQVITLGGPWIIAYGAKDGSELWRAELLTGEIAPSPIFVGGLVLAISPTDKLVGLRPDGHGNVTETHVAWKAEDNIPDITSPVSNGELVFLASTHGTLTCYDARDGAKQWEHELEFEVNATPAIGRDRLLVLGKKGEVLIAEAGRAFKELSRFEMGEPVLASPALVGDRVYVRTTQSLLGLGPGSATAPAPGANP